MIGLLTVIIILGIIIYYFKQRHFRERQALKELISITSAEKYELEKKYRITRDRLIEVSDDHENGQVAQTSHTDTTSSLESIAGNFRNWDHFRTSFIYRNPLYFDKLKKKHPELKAQDIKYCFCLFSKLTNQQTADLLGVTYDAVKKAKRKLKDKFQLDSVQDLPFYLESID